MNKTLLFFVLVFLVAACKNNPSSNGDNSSSEKEPTTWAGQLEKDAEEAKGGDVDIAAIVEGTHSGKGLYEYNENNVEDKVVTSVKLVRKDNQTVIVSSPEKIFPDFEIINLLDQFTSIAGRPAEGQGAMMYVKANKQMKVFIKQFMEEGTVLRFGN